MKMIWLRYGAAVFLCAVLLLTGCGGGGPSVLASGVGSGGTGITYGTLLGFGSVIVDGQRIDDSQAKVVLESEPGKSVTLTTSVGVAALGQQVEIQTDATGLIADELRIVPTLIGQVDNLGQTTDTLVIAGQTVRLINNPRLGAPTVLDGLNALSDLNPGDRVVVYGYPIRDDNTGQPMVLATRISLHTPVSGPTRVSGFIQNLNSNAKQFQIGNLLITYDTNSKILPANASLANGESVVVWNSQNPIAGVLYASTIRTVHRHESGKLIRVSGIVENCTLSGACAADFAVKGIAVNAALANYSNGSAANLANGVFVRLVGKMDSNGVLQAVSAGFRSVFESDVTLYGTVADFVNDQNFTVRGATVTTDSHTDKPAACVLANNQPVQISGSVTGNLVLAQKITCLNSIEGLTVDLQGVASNVNSGSLTLRINTQLGAIAVDYAGAGISAGTLSGITNGMYLVLNGKVASGVVVAKTVAVGTAPTGAQFQTQGIAYSVTSTRFRVNGLLINYVPSVVYGGALIKGAKAKVSFIDTGSRNYLATEVHVLTN